jgi:hypothetical protein
MKLFLSIFIVFTSLVSFSQLKGETEKTITTGETLYLKYIDASITPPAGYVFMEEFSSFLDQKTQTSISVVKDDKMPYEAFIENMLKKDYTIGNAELLSHEKLEKGYLFTFLFTINNAPVERIVYVTGTEEFCIWTSANYRQSEKEKYYNTLKECLLSIKYKL